MAQIDKCELISLEELKATEPGEYTLHKDKWWITKDGKLLFWKGRGDKYLYPQCNSNKEITTRLKEKMYPTCEVIFVPKVFQKVVA